MFIDEKNLVIRAGKGGDGATLFRREKYVPYGGPDGGDGGRGGDVIIEGQSNLHALNHLAHVDRIEAPAGDGGGKQRKTGKSGENTILQLPLGTLIEVKEGDEWKALEELTQDNQQFVIAKGGNGGWGNWHFKSSIQQAPTRSNPGLPGEEKEVRLTLKLIADVGLVGLPNAGKSTLLAAVSAAQPKIANYPFTTLEPQLGVAEVRHGRQVTSLVIADLPGLIEGASEGKGLGVQFLKHVERTRTIIHCLDSALSEEELVISYRMIRNELEAWSTVLAKKPERIALTKSELCSTEELATKKKKLEKATKKPVYLVSAAAHQGLTELLTGI
jgi:GTP-binding protein